MFIIVVSIEVGVKRDGYIWGFEWLFMTRLSLCVGFEMFSRMISHSTWAYIAADPRVYIAFYIFYDTLASNISIYIDIHYISISFIGI